MPGESISPIRFNKIIATILQIKRKLEYKETKNLFQGTMMATQ